MIQILSRAPLIGRTRYWLFDRYYNRFVQWMLIAACLLLTLVSTLLLRDATTAKDQLIGLIPVIVIGIVAFVTIVYTQMRWITLVVPIVSTMLHEGISTGTGTKLSFAFLIAFLWLALWLFKMFVIDRKITVRPSTANKPALLFIAVVVISYIWSWLYVDHQVEFLFQDKIFPRTMTAVLIIVSVLIYFLYANHMRSPVFFRRFVWIALALGAFYAGSYNIIFLPKIVQFSGQIGAWVAAFALGQFLCNTKLKWYMRLAMLGIIGFWIRVNLSLGLTWLSGWVPMVLVLGFLLFLRDRRWLFVGLAVVALYVGLNWQSLQDNFAREDEESGGTRAAAWEQALEVVSGHLLLGTGPAGYHFYYIAFGIYRSGVNLSHNNYVDIIGQTGLVGLAAWLFFWLSLGVMVWRLYRMPILDPCLNGLKYALVAFYPVVFVVMMLGDWVTPFTYTQTLFGIDYTMWNWILPGMIVALYHYGREEQARALQSIAQPTTK